MASKKTSHNISPKKKSLSNTHSFSVVPLADRVVVVPIVEEVTQSGILIPETANKERPERGTVVAIGPGKLGDDHTRLPLEVQVGDTVIFSKYGPDEITIKGTHYYILREDQILAIVK